MTYFDFMDFEPLKHISNNTYNKSKIMFASSTLSSSPTYIEAAGFEKSDITAEIKHKDLLHIKALTENYGKKSFEHVLVVPEEVDRETIELTVGNGIITIEFKNKKEQSRKIKVK